MKPETKENLKLQLLRLVGWFGFMAFSGLILAGISSGAGAGVFSTVLTVIVAIPSWGLPALIGLSPNIHNASGTRFLLGIALHLCLWFAFWERKRLWAWVKRKWRA
jgi:hypothetical protein